jgi:hypothetical protein
MKKTVLQVVFVLFILSTLPSCSEENNMVSEGFIDPELSPLLELFEAEASFRGQTVRVADYLARAEIVSMEDHLAGQCNFSEAQPNIMIINRSFWENAEMPEREYAVFHELGHCVLGRWHLDSLNENGDCVSLMHSEFNPCSKTYASKRRTEMLDELFANW